MPVTFSDTASLVLRITGSQPWSGLPNITQKGSILSYEELDDNQWGLYSWSLQLDNLSRGAAYTGSSNIFTEPQTFQGAITASGPVDLKSGLSVTGSGRITGTITGGGGLLLDGGAIIAGPVESATGFSGSGKDLYDVTASLALSASYVATASFATSVKVAGGYNGVTLVNGPNGIEASASQNINALATTASINELAGKVVLTSSFNTYTGSINQFTSSVVTTSSFNAATSSFVTTSSFNAFTASTITTSSLNAFTSSVVTTSSFNAFTSSVVTTSSFNAFTSSVVTTSSFNTFTSSYNTGSFKGTLDGTAATASYINLVAGPGISVNRQTGTNLLEITSSVRSVNGVFPTSGNIALSLTQTVTGNSASLVASEDPSPYSTGSIFVISGDAVPANNGRTFILVSGSGGNTEWVELTGFDTATADARYLKLDATNDPLQGNLSMGNFQINGLTEGTLSTDAINLGQLTQSVNAATGSLITLLNNSSSALTTNLNNSSSTLISLLNASSSTLSQSTALLSSSFNILSSSYSILSSSFRTGSFTGSFSGSFSGTLIGNTLQAVTTQGNSTSESISIFASGNPNTVSNRSLAIGRLNTANNTSVAHGINNQATGIYSYAQGNATFASNDGAHAEGQQTIAVGLYSHTEGGSTTAIGSNSHAEGNLTTAVGDYSHAEGIGTIANAQGQHVEGKYNITDTNAIWIVGDGTGTGARSNVASAYVDKFTVTGSLQVLSGSLNGDVITNAGDTFTSTPPVFKIVSLTAVEYAAIVTKDNNTLYIVI